MVHKLKPLRGRKWYETATMMFYCPALVATACVYFELFSPLTVIGWAVLFGAGPLVGRMDEMDKQILWLTERERERLLEEGVPIFNDNDFRET